MVSFEIRPLLPTDTLSLVKLHYRAFGNSISPILFSAAPSESCYETMAGERARILAKPDIKGFQAVSPAGEMIGAAYFHIAPNGVPQEQLDSEEPMWRTFAAAQVVDLWKAWGKCMGDRYKETVGTRACVEVLMLIVDPEAQGKGVGSRLLELGCQEADRLGCIAYVEATDVGVRTYEKFRFKTVGSIGFDASPWGHEGKFPVDTILIREPRTL